MCIREDLKVVVQEVAILVVVQTLVAPVAKKDWRFVSKAVAKGHEGRRNQITHATDTPPKG